MGDHDPATEIPLSTMDGSKTPTPADPTFETLLDTIGQFGRSQQIIFSLMTLADIMLALVMMFFIFATAAVPKWRCVEFDGLNQTYLTDANVTFEETCRLNGSKCIRFHFDDDYTSIATEWNLVCDRSHYVTMATSLLMFGMLPGSIVAAQLSDRYGRRKVLIVSMVLMLICQMMVGFSVDWKMYGAMRFMVGLFIVSCSDLTFVVPMEFIGPNWRSFCGALGIFDLGVCFTAVVCYLLKDWRHQAFVTGSISIPLVIAVIIFVPESVRWLIQMKRFDEAEKVIRWMARLNKKPVPDLSLLRKISIAQQAEREQEARYTYLDLFRTKKLTVTTITVILSWFIVSMIYYIILVSISSLSGNIYLNTVYASLPGLFLGWTVIPTVHWLGRKRTFVIYSSVAIICLLCIVILNATGHIGKHGAARTALALVVKVAIGEAWTVISIITAEVYPTLIRNLGIGMGSVSSRVGGIIAPYIVYLGELYHWTIPYIISGCLSVVCFILVLVVFPETNRQPLTEEIPTPDIHCWKRKERASVIVPDPRG